MIEVAQIKSRKDGVDSQRQKVYDAEKVLVQLSTQFDTEHDVLSFVNRVISRAPIARRYGKLLTISVGAKQLRQFNVTFAPRLVKTANATYSGINLGYSKNWSWHSWVVLHEMSHVIICRRHRRDDVAAHGREFCAVYLDLVKFTLGREAYEALKTSFRDHRVKFTKKRNVVFSEEQKAEMRERIKVARANLKPRTTKPENLITCARCSQKIAKHKFRQHWIDEHPKPRIVIDFPEDE